MKQNLRHTITCFLLLIGIANITYAQCIADAGENAALCTHWGLDSFHLGGTPTAMGGVQPYTYKWTCSYSNIWFTYTASDFLDDTTLSNPRITEFVDPSLTFYLEVTDATGSKCTDSITVQFSRYTILLDVKHAHIHQGDSARLHTSVLDGIPPISYLWSPSIGLSDPTDVYTWAKPDTSIVYHLLVTDSAGCQIGDNFYVIVVPTSTNEIHSNQIKANIFPNPLRGVSSFVISGTNPTSDYEIYIYDINGRFRKKCKVSNNKTEMDLSDLENGMYFYILLDRNEVVTHGKFVVQ